MPHADDPVRRHAAGWLLLATVAVAVSGLFAILIALARVPALGALFPGVEFYRVALTLHVNLSQGVWFMAFAAVLWTARLQRELASLDPPLLALAGIGASGLASSVAIGTPQPLMSNYLPVLDSPVFLGALALFVGAIVAKAMRSALATPPPARALGLWLAAPGFVGVALVALVSHFAIAGRFDGHAYFELLFWASGHAWQFVLVLLMMHCWSELAGRREDPPRLLYAIALVPLGASLLAGLALDPASAAAMNLHTELMRWASWPAPVALAVLLARHARARAPEPGFRLSVALFALGLLIGARIDGQTTLVTAHYHGTIGAVTLAFMACAMRMLPELGAQAIGRRYCALQLGLYGYGILLMMLGLAGAGLMGAPRKAPGELVASWSIETASRILLGVGGLLATLGILLFAFLVARRIWPSAAARLLQDDPAH